MLRKECPLCSQQINQYQYEEHFNSCSTDSLNQVQPTKQCPLCHDKFDQSLFANHLQSCSNTDQSLTDITSSQVFVLFKLKFSYFILKYSEKKAKKRMYFMFSIS
jgi:hypothetical protein